MMPAVAAVEAQTGGRGSCDTAALRTPIDKQSVSMFRKNAAEGSFRERSDSLGSQAEHLRIVRRAPSTRAELRRRTTTLILGSNRSLRFSPALLGTAKTEPATLSIHE